MKRVVLGGAALLLIALATPASADRWNDAFSGGYFGTVGSAGDRVAIGRAAFPGRSNLGAMTADDGEPRRAAPSRRASLAASADDDRPARSTRRSRATRQASVAGSGGAHGIASYYWQPQRVASGGWFNPNAMTAAHKTLPFGTKVRVTNVSNGRSAVVTINDRGPFIAGRIIDLSKAAAGAVGMIGSGLARVRMEVLGR